MTIEAKRMLAHRWFEEVWNARREDLIGELIHPEVVSHTVSGDVTGIDQFLDRVYRPFLGAFPDLQIEIENSLADEDDVAVRWHATGTHTGEGFGVPASGRRIALRGVTWIEIRDGRMVEGWDFWDSAALLAQLREPDAGWSPAASPAPWGGDAATSVGVAERSFRFGSKSPKRACWSIRGRISVTQRCKPPDQSKDPRSV